jgi:hypothetical protein
MEIIHAFYLAGYQSFLESGKIFINLTSIREVLLVVY